MTEQIELSDVPAQPLRQVLTFFVNKMANLETQTCEFVLPMSDVTNNWPQEFGGVGIKVSFEIVDLED